MRTVLIIDDNPAVAQALSLLFGLHDIRTLTAITPQKGLTMLAQDEAIRSVLLQPGVLDQAHAGLVHVVTATISVEFAGELAGAHEKAGIGYVSAPVLGRPNVAKEGQLNILTGGKAAAVAKANAANTDRLMVPPSCNENSPISCPECP